MNRSFLFWLFIGFVVMIIFFVWKGPLSFVFKQNLEMGKDEFEKFKDEVENLEIDVPEDAVEDEPSVLGETEESSTESSTTELPVEKRVECDLKEMSRKVQVLESDVDELQRLEDIETQLDQVQLQLEQIELQVAAL